MEEVALVVVIVEVVLVRGVAVEGKTSFACKAASIAAVAAAVDLGGSECSRMPKGHTVRVAEEVAVVAAAVSVDPADSLLILDLQQLQNCPTVYDRMLVLTLCPSQPLQHELPPQKTVYVLAEDAARWEMTVLGWRLGFLQTCALHRQMKCCRKVAVVALLVEMKAGLYRTSIY